MEFQDYLKINAKLVEKDLENLLTTFLNETKKTNSKLLPFAKKLKDSCIGGKRIRGVLCKLGYEITSSRFKIQDSRFKNEILKIGAAFEILHTALLIHDDIIDKSLTRRDKPSLYVSLGNPARLASESVGGRNHYGISQAITIGDIALYLPIKIITESKFSDEVKIKVLNYFSKILINTGWGQVMDVEKGLNDLSKKSLNDSSKGDKDKDFVNLYKTAKYTISGPLQIGAILGGASEKTIKLLGEFGENLGIAFQLQDDILDKESKDVRKTHIKAVEYADKSKKLIKSFTKDRYMISLLENLGDYLINREK